MRTPEQRKRYNEYQKRYKRMMRGSMSRKELHQALVAYIALTRVLIGHK